MLGHSCGMPDVTLQHFPLIAVHPWALLCIQVDCCAANLIALHPCASVTSGQELQASMTSCRRLTSFHYEAQMFPLQGLF